MYFNNIIQSTLFIDIIDYSIDSNTIQYNNDTMTTCSIYTVILHTVIDHNAILTNVVRTMVSMPMSL